MQNVIETSKLTKSFNSLTAVDKLDVTVETGEIFGLLVGHLVNLLFHDMPTAVD